MDLRPKESSAVFFFLVIFTLSKFSEVQSICSAEVISFIKENNAIGDIVTEIKADDGVTATITSQTPADLFSLDASLDGSYNLIAETVMDFETFDKNTPYEVNVECTKDGSPTTALVLRIAVQDVNDNPPEFAYSQYSLNVDELTEVGTSVGLITAIDPDESDRLYYRLDPEEYFYLQTDFSPNIMVKSPLDYDKVQKISMMLYAQDTATGSTGIVSHTTSTTIEVNIKDIDNRPPWFQPCNSDPNFAQVCIMPGYEGTVQLNEQETVPLELTPDRVYAIDGDKGRNEDICYAFLGGNEDKTFEINIDTGNITMLKPVDVAGPIVLTVMAYQKENVDQFATTTVILKVVISSNHPPTFVKPSYEGFISEDAGVDSLVLESKTSNRPLRVQATDEDFSNGYNPAIKFEVVDGTEFSITPEGFILMARTVSPGTVNLRMKVVDTSNGESSTVSLTVEVTPGGLQLKTGEFSTEEMAAVGASLAVVIVLCLVCIGLMVHRIKGHNTAWKKISEASIFRSTLGGGSGGPKEGMQYSNEGFQHDGDSGSVNSNLAADLENKLESGLKPQQRRGLPQENMTPSAASVLKTTSSSQPDSSSLAETIDGEKEVKPILTKERRTEEGYKAVWFKQDIDPNTKEDVVIIPDTGDADGDHEEDDDSEDEGNLRTDLDSEDEEDEEGLTSI
ncbi:cadherin-related family member 5 isoform X2 [Megalobrama amblycephala]|uniref:cadherin-related family member 5 isoform X2 n=1 Tax=Megalobrama amblycephala TaxID=75352 RepID=UPI00201436A9|nr:cadherin-related family member 5 isoform X2 [Megalobrama amblycephala]